MTRDEYKEMCSSPFSDPDNFMEMWEGWFKKVDDKTFEREFSMIMGDFAHSSNPNMQWLYDRMLMEKAERYLRNRHG